MPSEPDAHAERAALLERAVRALADRPHLRDALVHGDSWLSRPKQVTVVSADDVIKALVFVKPGGLVLTVNASGVVDLLYVDDKSHHSWNAKGGYHVAMRLGHRGEDGIRAVARLVTGGDRKTERMSSRPSLRLTERSVAIFEDLGPDDALIQDHAFAESPDGLGNVVRQAIVGSLLAPVTKRMSPDLRSLVTLLAEGRPEFDPELALVVAMAAVPHPARVEAALRTVPFLYGAFDPRLTPADAPRTHVASLSDGKAPHEVVADLVRPMLPEGTVPPPAALRSIGNLDHETPDLTATVRTIIAFHVARPSHRSLDAEEVGNVARLRVDATFSLVQGGSATVGGTDVAHALLDGNGRLGPPPQDLADALRSLWDTLGEFATHADEGAEIAEVAAATAFPPGRRLDGLMRVDRAWHAVISSVQQDLSDARALLLSHRAGEGTQELPHLVRETMTFGDVTVVPLLSEADYVAEGQAMSHCVGVRAGRAWTGTMVGFSLHCPAGRSTLTYTIDTSTGEILVREHRGLGNGGTPGPHVAAEAGLRRSLDADAEARKALVATIARRKGLEAAGRDLPKDVTRAERDTVLAIHFRALVPWLEPSQVAMGHVAWWASMTRRFPRRT